MSSTNSNFRVAVVGCGAIAEIFHLPALVASNLVREIVLVDTNSDQLERLAQKFDIESTFENLTDLAGCVDAVIVATPPSSHYAICKWSLENGLHVLCEKPLTEEGQQAQELVQIAQQQGRILAVNQTRRFFPSSPKIRELIAGGALGRLESITYHDGVEFDWPAASPHHFQPGAKGAWSDTGVHLLDTICYWLDAKPKLTASQNDSHAGPEAMATVQLEHAGCQVELKVSRLGRLMNGFEIIGSKAMIKADAEEFAEVRVEHRDGSVQKHHVGSRKTTYPDLALPVLEDFLSACAGDSQPRASGASTLGTIELLEQAYEEQAPYAAPWNQDLESSELPRVTSSERKRVLVTGASGFVGGRVVEILQSSEKFQPVATIRNWSRAARVARFPVDIRLGNLLDRESLRLALEGVHSVVHCAKADDYESIVTGTRNLLDMSAQQGVQRLVFLSTAEVYGNQVQGEVTETAPTEAQGNIYGDSKIEAERLCFQRNGCDGLTTSILRPSLIHGPFSTSWSIDIAKRLQSGNWGVFDEHGEGNANLIYVDDLVQAIELCLTEEAAAGEAFNVNGPDELTWNEYFQRFNQALGRPPLQEISSTRSRLRTWVMGQVGFLADKVLDRFEDKLMEIYLRGGWASRVMKRIKGELHSTPSTGELHDLFSRKAHYCDSKARTLLGYDPRFSIDLALEHTLAWLKHHELVAASEHEQVQSVPPSRPSRPSPQPQPSEELVS